MRLTTLRIHVYAMVLDSYEWKQYHSGVGLFADGGRWGLNAGALQPILWRSEDPRVIPACSPGW